jgi:hypothetical protein
LGVVVMVVMVRRLTLPPVTPERQVVEHFLPNVLSP